MQSKLRLMEKVKFSLYQISFKTVHKSSLLLSFNFLIYAKATFVVF